jgi:adenylate cyclase
VKAPGPAGRTADAGFPHRRFVLFTGLAPALVIAALTITPPAAITQLNYRTYDTLLRSSPPVPPPPGVVVVDIDDRSLAAVGQWPWRRDVVAQLTTRLHEEGARVVAFDVIFSEPDRDAGGGADGRPAPDAVLAEAFRAGGVVLGYGLTFDGSGQNGRECHPHFLDVAMVHGPDAPAGPTLFRADGVVCNLPALARAAGRSGFLNAVPDSDGILRRVPLLIDYKGRTVPSLALSAVLLGTGGQASALHVVNANTSELILTRGGVPLDGLGNILVRYRGPARTFPSIPASDVLEKRYRPGAFRDAIVFIGATALGTREVVATPLGTRLAGVEVHATIADNLLRRDFIYRTEHAPAIELAMIAALTIGSAFLLAHAGLRLGALASGILLACLWLVLGWLLSNRGVYLSALGPTLGVLTALAAGTLARLTAERGRADRAIRDKDTARRLMIRSLLSLTETRDVETGSHSRRIQQYSRLLATELAKNPAFRHLTADRIDLLANLAPLHDIGKVGIPDRLLNKPGPLTEAEFREMKKHPIYGLDVITRAQKDAAAEDDETLEMAKDIVYTHHEWWDGTGYPRGLAGEAIPVAGRIVAAVDVYDALTARRLYRAPVTHDQAVQLIVLGSGSHFDPAVVEAFVAVAPRLLAVDRGHD